jgi:FemAB-related protein (PEP-CTERM system-associated)
VLAAREGGDIRGLLALGFVRSQLFGRYLVSLPYLNYGGVLADDDVVARLLIDRAINLADHLSVRYLELRHEDAVEHPALISRDGPGKVHMRLPLPRSREALWEEIPSKARNQVRKGQRTDGVISWGGTELLPEFYAVFTQNMRDLGTPTYGKSLFRTALEEFHGDAEICVVRCEDTPAGAALLVHGAGTTEVLSASTMRRYNPLCVNMLMYWHLLERAVDRGQNTFDFGRTTPGSNTFNFKRQWGARPTSANWQYYVRSGTPSDMRPDNPRYRRFIDLWRRLPVPVTRWIGPSIVRGIP